MLRAIAVGLFSIGCAGGPGEVTGVSEQATEFDGGVEQDAGEDPQACDWFVYWLTTIESRAACNWGIISRDTSTTLFRTNGGECLAPATVCGIAACSDLTFLEPGQVVELWGPAGMDDGDVWAATETFNCE